MEEQELNFKKDNKSVGCKKFMPKYSAFKVKKYKHELLYQL